MLKLIPGINTSAEEFALPTWANELNVANKLRNKFGPDFCRVFGPAAALGAGHWGHAGLSTVRCLFKNRDEISAVVSTVEDLLNEAE